MSENTSQFDKGYFPEYNQVKLLGNAVNAFSLIPLDERSFEHKSVMELINMTGIEIINISRVANYYLERSYELKKQQMISKNELPHELFSFHGTKKESAENICRVNFNWRLSGSRSRHCYYGKGVYFMRNASDAKKYPKKSEGQRFMILSKVLFRNCVIGFPFMVLPPPGCDTTTSRDLKEIVKFEDNEFCPMYIIIFSINDEVTHTSIINTSRAETAVMMHPRFFLPTPMSYFQRYYSAGVPSNAPSSSIYPVQTSPLKVTCPQMISFPLCLPLQYTTALQHKCFNNGTPSQYVGGNPRRNQATFSPMNKKRKRSKLRKSKTVLTDSNISNIEKSKSSLRRDKYEEQNITKDVTDTQKKTKTSDFQAHDSSKKQFDVVVKKELLSLPQKINSDSSSTCGQEEKQKIILVDTGTQTDEIVWDLLISQFDDETKHSTVCERYTVDDGDDYNDTCSMNCSFCIIPKRLYDRIISLWHR